MMTLTVDLDRPETWPSFLVRDLRPLLPAIMAERQAEANRLPGSHTSPPTPATHQAHALVSDAMSGRKLRVFHATRLVDPDAIRTQGLHALDLDRHIDRVRRELVQAGWFASSAEVDAILSRVDLSDFAFKIRCGDVWFVPLRRQLHDGGLDDMFAHWGGEVVRQIAQETDGLTDAIRRLGKPFVVTAVIPALGCCTRAHDQLPIAMTALMLERAGLIDNARGSSWDVRIDMHVPSNWIESILPPDHPDVAG